MKTQMPTRYLRYFKGLAEGLYQYSQARRSYPRFKFHGQREIQKLRPPHCTSLPEDKRMLSGLKNNRGHSDMLKSKKTYSEILTEY